MINHITFMGFNFIGIPHVVLCAILFASSINAVLAGVSQTVALAMGYCVRPDGVVRGALVDRCLNK